MLLDEHYGFQSEISAMTFELGLKHVSKVLGRHLLVHLDEMRIGAEGPDWYDRLVQVRHFYAAMDSLMLDETTGAMDLYVSGVQQELVLHGFNTHVPAMAPASSALSYFAMLAPLGWRHVKLIMRGTPARRVDDESVAVRLGL
ncbi:MAG: hypothetical protein ACK4MS_16520, partial [Paracoccaceae bacterium]